MRTPEHREAVDPRRELWLIEKLPFYLVRFYEPVCTMNGAVPTLSQVPVMEHVYRPSGMYHYKHGQGFEYHYLYEQTRKV